MRRVVEMRSYMPDIDGRGEGERINQVVVLEDTDGDGHLDQRSVYMRQSWGHEFPPCCLRPWPKCDVRSSCDRSRTPMQSWNC